MLGGSRSFLILLAILNALTVVGMLYAVVSTDTYYEDTDDFGGNPAHCQGSAYHNFTVTGSCNYTYSYSTSVFHNGQFVDDDYDSDSGVGPANFTKLSFVSGIANAVFAPHYTNGSHGSYIQNDDNPDDWDQDTGSSNDFRTTD